MVALVSAALAGTMKVRARVLKFMPDLRISNLGDELTIGDLKKWSYWPKACAKGWPAGMNNAAQMTPELSGLGHYRTGWQNSTWSGLDPQADIRASLS